MDLELQFAVFGGQEAMRALGDTNDFSVDADDSTGEFIQKAQTDLLTKGSVAIIDAGWNEPIGTVVEKREPASTGKTMAQKLGITKTEVSEPDEDGIRHVRAYNANGELVLYKTLFREVA